MTEIQAKVHSITPLTANVYRIVLALPQPLPFKAGQYLRVIMGDKDKRPFSIASAPGEDELLELHIGAAENNPWTMQVIEKLRQQPFINIDGPHGKAHLRENGARPRILIAGGTGFSYTWSILQELLRSPLKEPLFLYWGTRTLDDMYAHDALVALAAKHEKFKFIPVLDQPHHDWQGRNGWVHKAVMEDFISLEPYEVYIAGRFEMAGVAREDFHQQGLLLENLFGDAYEFI
ncbi:NAD(P)H-flavin reductase [Aliiglaciecola sp. CAU 1673]|uniref:NAD(P)H-flavin reductase n=1 Tax=Aliiglaciecola sp. CAU 1673 TaxID=3032595 RepID=UPI0023D98731|nr:NAD(P)H-flavin reductase [Aliiglaciecola sp. CAU 1673]MDF2179069.1 NAD(P)H-flavin reductase [Aliiglaciecola sp. CAU 1673]